MSNYCGRPGNESLWEDAVEALITTVGSGAIYGAIIVGSLQSTEELGKPLVWSLGVSLLNNARPRSHLCRVPSNLTDRWTSFPCYDRGYPSAKDYGLSKAQPIQNLKRKHSTGNLNLFFRGLKLIVVAHRELS